MTVDPLAVLFWTAALVSGWRAIRNYSVTRWCWTGLWMGCGFLSKYTTPLQLLCWVVFFILWKPARPQLRRLGPYLALLVVAFCALPVLIWNAQNGWISAAHVAEHGGMGRSWRPVLRYVGDFIGAEALLLNPIYFLGAGWASIVFWRRSAQKPLLVFLFSMGAPVFLFYLLLSLHSRVLPNWIAPTVLPLFCLMIVYAEERWRDGNARLKSWLITGLGLGFAAVILAHDTDLIGKFAGRPLPPSSDPLRRVRSWVSTAQVVQEARRRLLTEGKPVFIIGSHYGITSLLTFYLPEAKAAVATEPLVYYQHSPQPVNQYFFWPGYQRRKGENAIFVLPTDNPVPPPDQLQREFAAVQDLGLREIQYHGRVFHRFQLFECRGLR
jgi:4-amino-4-deoxy-L-arabinose transferase-like glycosyltransferase